MKKSVKNTLGPYKVVCTEVARVGSSSLIGWIRSHNDGQLRCDLLEHVILCHRCKEVHKQALDSLPEMTHEEFQATFDPSVCVEVTKHRNDLIDWLYSIRGTDLYYDVQFHIGICDRCPATLEEMDAVLEVPED